MQTEEVQRLMSVFGLSPRGSWHPDVSDGMEAVPWFFTGGQLLGPDVKSPRSTRPTVGGSTLSSSRAAARSSDYQYTHRMSRSRGKPYDKTMAKMAVED